MYIAQYCATHLCCAECTIIAQIISS